ncbi:uncharacterized protein LOC130277174 [Hyla sarda]|uniref:uncharacterized protein LOC130277174 n=1 Tax=Hyla sarda TaxID=327740 RepID=UPI0024C4627D|nr:uncharacterized protein LOC130277174 [Hyla sarda]
MRPQPPAHSRSDRAWVTRCLEQTTASLKELHVMRLEAEERVRGVLRSTEKGGRGRWRRRCTQESVEKRNQDLDRTLPTMSRSLDYEDIQEEVIGRLRRSSLGNLLEMSPPEDLDSSPPSRLLRHDLVEGAQAKGHTRKLGQWSVESLRPAKTILEEQSIDQPQPPRRWNQEPADGVTSSHPWQCPSSTWTRAQDLKKTVQNMEETMEQSEDPEPLLSVFPAEFTSLRRMGSGSLAPRLRLGSSGVTSDILFTRRMSGNCMSAHSSGFYETSDLDSTSSSCSSLCSDISCHTSVSVMSPCRNSVVRPRSIDCTMERRKELQSGTAQTKRPMSAGALDGFLQSASSSRYDLAQSYDVAPCDHPFSGPPPLSAIQQRRKAERYICKLALKYRCKPGGSTVLPDLGPPTPRRPAHSFLSSGSPLSCPPSPQITSLSSSMVDVRKHSTGSWGRFLSRVVLKKDSRIAASELNLEQCWKNSGDAARSPSLAEGQFVRAKSFRDLLSVNPFKRSQRGLNKVW